MQYHHRGNQFEDSEIGRCYDKYAINSRLKWINETIKSLERFKNSKTSDEVFLAINSNPSNLVHGIINQPLTRVPRELRTNEIQHRLNLKRIMRNFKDANNSLGNSNKSQRFRLSFDISDSNPWALNDDYCDLVRFDCSTLLKML